MNELKVGDTVDLLPIQEQSRRNRLLPWISVKEAVPSAHCDVLITNGKRIYIGHTGNDCKSWFTDLEGRHFKNFREDEVTHWALLPALPEVVK